MLDVMDFKKSTERQANNPPGAAYAAPPSFAQGGHIGSLCQRELAAQQPEGLVNRPPLQKKNNA